jgi:hypothetical protein
MVEGTGSATPQARLADLAERLERYHGVSMDEREAIGAR